MHGQGRITTSNPAAQEILGYSEVQILGRLAQDALHCKGGDNEDCPILLAMRGHHIPFSSPSGGLGNRKIVKTKPIY